MGSKINQMEHNGENQFRGASLYFGLCVAAIDADPCCITPATPKASPQNAGWPLSFRQVIMLIL